MMTQPSQPHANPQRPNIVVVLADDLGCGDVSALNPNCAWQTPHIDRVAREGMTFADGHSNAAVCTPTRYGLLTGRYCWRTPLKRGVLGGYSKPLIEPDRVTLASYLAEQGYRTACIGKWHLGLQFTPAAGGSASPDDKGFDFTRPLTHTPNTVGFHDSFIFSASLDMPPYAYIENDRFTEPVDHHSPDSSHPKFWRGGARSRGFEHECCLRDITRRAEAFIADHATHRREQPFFLYFPTPSPHTPYTPRRPFQGQTPAGPYGDYVLEHDWSIGQLLGALDRHGLADNTLVLISSDHGAHSDSTRAEALCGHRPNAPWRGQKSDVWEGGHRVPFIIRWPQAVAPDSICNSPVCSTDVLATVAAITQQPLPAHAAEDSVSFLPHLTQQPNAPERPAMVLHSISGCFALRRGNWKLIDGPGSGGWSLPDDQVPAGSPPRQLYDLANDPGEQHNRYEDQSELAQELLGELDTLRAEA